MISKSYKTSVYFSCNYNSDPIIFSLSEKIICNCGNECEVLDYYEFSKDS